MPHLYSLSWIQCIQLVLLLLQAHYFLTTNSFFLSLLTAVCKAGSYSPTGLEPCFPCEKGFYQGTEGQRLCLKCGVHKTTSEEGSTSSKQCRGTLLFNNSNNKTMKQNTFWISLIWTIICYSSNTPLNSSPDVISYFRVQMIPNNETVSFLYKLWQHSEKYKVDRLQFLPWIY